MKKLPKPATSPLVNSKNKHFCQCPSKKTHANLYNKPESKKRKTNQNQLKPITKTNSKPTKNLVKTAPKHTHPTTRPRFPLVKNDRSSAALRFLQPFFLIMVNASREVPRTVQSCRRNRRKPSNKRRKPSNKRRKPSKKRG